MATRYRIKEYTQVLKNDGTVHKASRLHKIPVRSYKRLTEKIVRGIFYIEDKVFIDSPYSITFYALSDVGAEPIADLLESFGAVHASGPGISIKRAVASEDKLSSFISIEIWKTFKMYASVNMSTE